MYAAKLRRDRVAEALGTAPMDLERESAGVLALPRRGARNEPPPHFMTPAERAQAAALKYHAGASPARRRPEGVADPFQQSAAPVAVYTASGPTPTGGSLDPHRNAPAHAPAPFYFDSRATRSLLQPDVAPAPAPAATTAAAAADGGSQQPMVARSRSGVAVDPASRRRYVEATLTSGRVAQSLAQDEYAPPPPVGGRTQHADEVRLARRQELRDRAVAAASAAGSVAGGGSGEAGYETPRSVGGVGGGSVRGGGPASSAASAASASTAAARSISNVTTFKFTDAPSADDGAAAAAAGLPRGLNKGGGNPGEVYKRELTSHVALGSSGSEAPAAASRRFVTTTRATYMPAAAGVPGATAAGSSDSGYPRRLPGGTYLHSATGAGVASTDDGRPVASRVAPVVSPAKQQRIGSSLASFLMGGQ